VPHVPHPEFLIFVPHAITNVVKYIKHAKEPLIRIFTHREVGLKNNKKKKKRGAAKIFLNRPRGVWVPDKTLFQVFDMASQTINSSWRNSSKRLENFMLIKIRYPKHRHGSDFLRFLL